MVAVAIVLAGCGVGGDDSPPSAPSPSAAVPPLPLPGPYAVACSNVAQDFNRVAQGEQASDYWEGSPSAAGTPQYVTDLLVDPSNALAVTVAAPDDPGLFGSFAGKQVSFVVLACYPTAADNPRPDYPLPMARAVPRMQTGADPPWFAEAGVHYPVLVFSHGLRGSPISSDYLEAISTLASHGYVVLAPFHGDPRFADLEIDDVADAVTLLTHLSDFLAMQSLRPLAVSAALDLLLAHPQWRDHIDPNQVGGFGASMGGETMLLLAGAGLTSSSGLAWRPVGIDSRVMAAVGYVPYFGQWFLPAFGRDQRGLDNVTLPFLAIGGTSDTTAPIAITAQGMERLAGTRELVALSGVPHRFEAAAAGDIFTWTLLFLDAEVRGNPAARKVLSSTGSVAGGGDDRVLIPYNGPES